MRVKTGPGKKIILIVIDSLQPEILARGIAGGTLPALAFLAEQGMYTDRCVSVFPTMTPAAAATIITGSLPDGHGIPGFVWYDREEKRIVNYGATPRAILHTGFAAVLQDILINLNCRHLNSGLKTLHEIIEERGLTSASINFFIYRGKRRYKVWLPFWARILSGFKIIPEVWGPSRLTIGRLKSPEFKCEGCGLPQGVLWKYGFNDKWAGQVARQMIVSGEQAHFTVVYLPDTDGYTHRRPVSRALPAVSLADRQIAGILDAYGSWEQALAENIFIVVGDHSQSQIGEGRDSIIDLDGLLAAYKQLGLGRLYTDEELALCPNERMAMVYLLDSRAERSVIIDKLAADPRIDHVLWRFRAESGAGREWNYHIRRGGSGEELVFGRGGTLTDVYGRPWTLYGDPAVLDLVLQGAMIEYGDYPDAMNLITALLDAGRAGDVVVTARPGCEFGGEAAPIHPGRGSHGSFHRSDALVPLIITGADEKIARPRLVDLAPFILRQLGTGQGCSC